MSDPRQIAASIVGAIEWQTETQGLCACPGASAHTSASGKKDCRINIDGAPTIFCFHASCAPIVADANKKLRRALGGAGDWAIVLPGGRTLRSGDVLTTAGTIKPREVVKADAITRGVQQGEAALLETIKRNAETMRTKLLEQFNWPLEAICQCSPRLVADRDPEDQFKTWLLALWEPYRVIWNGDIYSSGKPAHSTHFRTVQDFYKIGTPALGNFTAGCSFKPGSYARTKEQMNGRSYMVVESDVLGKDEVGAIFRFINVRLHFNLHAIIDTGGKSLHAWFSAPKNDKIEGRLKAFVTGLACDPKTFSYTQPVRVPGAWRDGKLQRLVWLEEKTR